MRKCSSPHQLWTEKRSPSHIELNWKYFSNFINFPLTSGRLLLYIPLPVDLKRFSPPRRARTKLSVRAPLIWTIVAAFSFAGVARASEKPVSYDFSAVTKLIQGWVDHGYYPGAAVRVVKDGNVVYEKCFGGFTPSTVVSLVSSTKWLEAACVMTLVDDGKIDLDAPLSKYLPQFKGDAGRATVRQCLSHTSGLNSIKIPETDAQTISIADRADELAAGELKEKPGTRFQYGGNGIGVAGRVAEVVSGKPWEILFADRIANPCEMHWTTTGMNLWYVRCHGGARWSASSSLDDYSNFLEMISNDGMFHGKRVLSANAIREMQADQLRGADRGSNDYFKLCGSQNGIYGFGEWREQVDQQGNATLLSSPGYYGYYPWLDKKHHAYGVFEGDGDNPVASKAHFPAFFSSPEVARLVASAFEAGSKASQ